MPLVQAKGTTHETKVRIQIKPYFVVFILSLDWCTQRLLIMDSPLVTPPFKMIHIPCLNKKFENISLVARLSQGITLSGKGSIFSTCLLSIDIP